MRNSKASLLKFVFGMTLLGNTVSPATLSAQVVSAKNTVTFKADANTEVDYLAFCRDGKTLASAHSDKTIKLWDIAQGKRIKLYAIFFEVSTCSRKSASQLASFRFVSMLCWLGWLLSMVMAMRRSIAKFSAP